MKIPADTWVTITQPKEEAYCPHACLVEGRVEKLPEDAELWVVKEPRLSNFHPDSGPIKVEKDGAFTTTAYIGNANLGADQGLSFPVHIIACGQVGSDYFRRYLKQAAETGDWPGLSTLKGGKIMATVTVIRKDEIV